MSGVNFLYYCSLQDVKDWLLNFEKTSSSTNFTDKFLRRAISRAYGQLNAALKKGGYLIPVVNSVKTLMTGAEVASDNPVVVAVTAGEGSNFSTGETVRIHGLFTTDTAYKDEFTGIVLISTDNITVEFLEDSYDAGATMELCTEGYLHLRECLALGASAKAAQAILIKAVDASSNLDRMLEQWNSCLDKLANGEIELDGLDKDPATIFIETFQTENSDAEIEPSFERNMDH